MYGTHTMRRTKASLIYRRTKNLRAVQLLLGHTKLESTVRYLGIEVDDALEMANFLEECEHIKRLKAFFGYGSGAPDKAGAPQASVYKKLSSYLRPSESLAPHSKEEAALNFYPPECPPLPESPSELRTRYCAYIAEVESLETPVTNKKLQLLGEQLARELLGKAIDLGSSKAHEFSPDIYWLIQSAAIVSLFADGPYSDVFANYRSHVHYYKIFKSLLHRLRHLNNT